MQGGLFCIEMGMCTIPGIYPSIKQERRLNINLSVGRILGGD